MSKQVQQNGSNPALEAGQRAIKKLIEEHRRSGEPMVISPEPGLLQWVVPQADGTMKVVREERVGAISSQ
jgi:hypothetical protein